MWKKTYYGHFNRERNDVHTLYVIRSFWGRHVAWSDLFVFFGDDCYPPNFVDFPREKMVMFHTYVSLPEGIFSNMLALTNAHHVTRCHFPSSQIASLIYVYIVIIFIDRRFFALPPPQDMTRMSTWACIAYHMIADDRHVNLSWFSTSYHWNPQFQETIRKYKHIQRQTYTDIHRHTQTYTHAYTHTYRHVRTYIALGYITLQKYIHTHTCMCIYIYTYIKDHLGHFLFF